MIPIILNIRLQQGWRYLKELGFLRFVLLLAVIALFAINIYGFLSNIMYAYILLGIQTSSTLSLHISRSDKTFLKVARLNLPEVFLIEYFLFCIPMSILLLVSGYWWLAILLPIFNCPIAFLNWNVSALNFRVFNLPFISPKSFEWKSGVRNQLPNLVVCYLLALVFINLFYISLVFVLFLTFIFVGFYVECEPREMIETFRLPSQKFLLQKIKLGLWNFILFVSPIVTIFLVLHIEFWYLMAYDLFIGCLLISLSILLKYAIYEPNYSLSFNSVLIGLATISLLVPFLAPVPLVMWVIYFRKAIMNLNSQFRYL